MLVPGDLEIADLVAGAFFHPDIDQRLAAIAVDEEGIARDAEIDEPALGVELRNAL
ncbi:MAG: hypothetical protein IPF98_14455 [Gemmatimonadetes bacterium]|nr:hypothetical protein [Gemmatimonadota bacterium]